MKNLLILFIVLSTFAILVDCKTVRGVMSSRLARLDQGQYITKFCFYGNFVCKTTAPPVMPSFSSTHTYPSLQDGKFLDWSDSDFILKEVDKILTLPWWTGDALVRFHLNTTSTGKLYFYLDEKWSQVEQTSQCQNKLDLAQYSFGLNSTSGENKFSPWTDPKLWHVLYADSVTCDSSVPALEDITFTLEMYNPNSEGKPTIHCGCDETGLLPFYEVLAFIYFAGAIAYGQRLWQTIEKGGPMHLMIKVLSVAMVYQAIGHFLAVIHLYRYSKNGEGYPFLQLLSIVSDGLAEYQMLLMMAKVSTGWTLSSSFSTLDPKHMKQIIVCVVTISVLEVVLLFWGTGLLQVLVKIVIAGAFGLNISRKITEERSTLRKEFYVKFAKCSFTRVLAYPTLTVISFVLPTHTRFKVITWGLLTAQSLSILLLYKLFLSRSLYWEVSSLATSTLPLLMDRGHGNKDYKSESRTVRIHKHIAVN